MINWMAWGSLLLIGVAFVTDIRTMRIPNWLTLSFAPLGVALHSGINGIGGLRYSAAGIAAGFLPLLLLYMFGGIGAGDVKLFAAAGAWMGCVPVAELMMYSFLYGGAGAAPIMPGDSLPGRLRQGLPPEQEAA